MKIEEVIGKLKTDSIISRKEYEDIVRQINPNLSDRTIFDSLQNYRIWVFCGK